MGASPEEVLSDVGERLSRASSNKDVLVKLLKQAAGVLSKLRPSLSLGNALGPLNGSLVQHNLLHHRDKDVKLLMGFCFIQVMRVLAPNPPYSDEELKVVFKLLISSFAELADTSSPYFARRAEMLETFSALRCCVLMLDIGCKDQVLEMFKVFFSVIREDHQQSLYQAMLNIMTHIMEEKITAPLLDMILLNLLKEEKGVIPSFKLAVSVVQNCSEKLAPCIWGFLTSISGRNGTGRKLKESYHEIILEIAQCAPQMLNTIIPKLTEELLIDQVDVRIKAVHLLGRLFALPGRPFAKDYHKLFAEFMKRLNDKSVDVRISAIDCAKACYLASPAGMEAAELLTALEGRLLDYDDKVRIQAVNVVCDLAKVRLRHIRPDIILHVSERLRDKKVSVRKVAMQKLLELYQSYCMECCMENEITLTNQFEQIPSRILALCYDKDCKDFRPQSMEHVLAEDLFPASISVEERSKHWISFYSFFSSPHIKALNTILSQKQRLQMEMQEYLAFRKTEKANGSEEVHQKFLHCFKKMSNAFVDPSIAVENFQKLHKSKDNDIFKTLLLLVGEATTFTASHTIRDEFLKRLGKKHLHYEFLKVLSAKCSHNIFSADQVKCILLDSLSRKRAGNLQTTCINLLLNIVSMFPFLLKGSEEHILEYVLEEGNTISESLLKVIAKAGRYISAKFSDIYPYLELACLEGTRMQSKYSVSAIAAVADASIQTVFSDLYSKLVDSLLAGQNISTVLQSLGCLAQYSRSTYSGREEDITTFVTQKLFVTRDIESSEENDLFNSDDGCSPSCHLITYGLKTLVRSCLPHEGTPPKQQLKRILDILMRLIPDGDTSDVLSLSENDKAHIRLGSAKAVLRLAGRWDLHVSPRVFHSALMKSRDPSSFVRHEYIAKVHKLLKQHAIPIRYACAFPLAASDCFSAVRANPMECLVEFIKEYGREARVHQMFDMKGSGEATMTNYPDYVVVYLVHILAHDVGFPSQNCQDEQVYARLCSPLVVFLHALLNPSSYDEKKSEFAETVSYLLSIFRAIKKAEDATDDRMTQKLHLLSDIGVLIVKALSQDVKFLPNAAKTVLLPSSYYKVGYAVKAEEAKLTFLGKQSIGGFIEMVLNACETHVAQGVNMQTKPTKKISDNNMCLEVVKSSKKELLCQKQTDLVLHSGKVNKENGIHLGDVPDMKEQLRVMDESEKVLSPVVLNTLKPAQNCTISCEDKKTSPGSSEAYYLREDQVSSCGSVVTKPSISESQIFTREPVLHTKNAESLDCPSSSDSVYILTSESSELGYSSQELVGHRIRLWSPLDKCFRPCTIGEFNFGDGTHKVSYDNGDIAKIRLANENWQLENSSLLDKDSGNFSTKQSNLKVACGDKVLQQQITSFDRHAGNVGGKRRILSERITRDAPAKNSKPSVPAGCSKLTSVVTNDSQANLPRRTRRRKT